jgi:hypothetical protein
MWCQTNYKDQKQPLEKELTYGFFNIPRIFSYNVGFMLSIIHVLQTTMHKPFTHTRNEE